MFDHRQTSGRDFGRPEEHAHDLAPLLTRVRRQVTRYVAQRRDAGTPIERVLPEVRALVQASQAVEQWSDPSDALMAQVVRWTICAYYDEPALAHVPLFY